MSAERRHGLWHLLSRAGVYDTLQAVLGAEKWRRALIEDHAKPLAGERILDLGCGTGALRRYVRQADYLGIDRNPDYIAAASERYPPASDWMAADVADLAAIEPGRFDVVVGAGLLHHLDDTVSQEMIRTAASLLKPGGRLAMLDPVFIDGQHPIARRLAELDRGCHVRRPDEYRALLSPVFQSVEIVIRDDLLNLPYNHAISIGRRPNQGDHGA
ncbi:MAG: class I SAM-dependent methyltransferase [Alphaproteobacteria bacterium]|nr:class I SAM-dependent methyltransferase [Alphaproteobacteria bacterium]